MHKKQTALIYLQQTFSLPHKSDIAWLWKQCRCFIYADKSKPFTVLRYYYVALCLSGCFLPADAAEHGVAGPAGSAYLKDGLHRKPDACKLLQSFSGK